MSKSIPGAGLRDAIERANARGRPALAPFLTAGFPDRARFDDLLDAVASHADVVEIGVPFSDPMADGVTIQRSSRVALEAGVTPAWIFEMLARRRRTAPVVLMSYLNPLLRYDVDRLVEHAAAADVAGMIVPDLPFEECALLRDPLEAAGLALIQLVTPVTPAPRLRQLCEASRGFVYAVTMTGTTGGAAAHADSMFDYLERVRAASSVPVLAGFGIRTAGQLARIAGHADGAIVGSALIEVLGRGDDPVAFLNELRGEDNG